MRFCLIFISLLLNACTGLSPAFKNEQVINASYNEVSVDINSYQNADVRWGGVIVKVENNENSSLIQVMYYPLDYYGRPELDKSSEGQFVIKIQESLDPKDYATDRGIIVVGKIDGKIERMVDGRNIQTPLIMAKETHLWPIDFQGNYYGNCRGCYFKQLFW